MTRLLLTSIFWSVRNRVHSRLRRLKQARYLVGTLAALLYYGFVFRPWGGRASFVTLRGSVEVPDDVLGAAEVGGAMLLTLLALVPWVLPGRRGALSFTEAEIAFLFPAPLTRKQIVDYSLMKSQFGILIGVLIFTFFAARHLTGSFLHAFIVVWVLFTAMSLYSLAVGITIAALSGHGAGGWRRFWPPIAVGAASIAAVGWTFASGRVPAPGAGGAGDLAAYVAALGATAPMSWVLFPCRLLVHPFFAQGALSIMASLVPAGLVILAGYAWVIRSDHRYEEVTAERAARRAARHAARRRTGRAASRGRLTAARPPFPLSRRASPATALFWRSLTAAWRLSGWRIISLVLATAMGAAWLYAAFIHEPGQAPIAGAFGIMPLIFAGVLVIAGPDMVRTDLRYDLLQIDVLKGFPVTGQVLIASEVLAPAALIGCLQAILLLTALPLALLDLDVWTTGQMLAACAGAFVLALSLDLLSGVLHNAGVLLFPGWHQLGLAQPRGMEAFGQVMIGMLLRLLAFTVVLLPAAAIAALTLFLTWPRLGASSIPLAALLASLPAMLMAWLGVKTLGLLFERFDPSKELDGLV